MANPFIVGPTEGVPGSVDVNVDGTVLPIREEEVSERFGGELPSAAGAAGQARVEAAELEFEARNAEALLAQFDVDNPPVQIPPTGLEAIAQRFGLPPGASNPFAHRQASPAQVAERERLDAEAAGVAEEARSRPTSELPLGARVSRGIQEFGQALARDNPQIAQGMRNVTTSVQAPPTGAAPFGVGGISGASSPLPMQFTQAEADASMRDEAAAQAAARPDMTFTTEEVDARTQAADQLALRQQQAAQPRPPAGARRGPGPGARRGQFEGQILESFDRENQAVEAQQRILDAQIDRRDQLMRKAQERADILNEQREEAEQERQASLRESQDGLARMRDQIANERIEPNQFWRERGESSRIAAALAIGAGSLGGALGGQENVALGIIRDAVDKNIDAQRTAMARDERLLSFDERQLSQLYSQFEDERMRDEAARVGHWEAVQRQLNTLASNTTDRTQIANLARLSAQVGREQATAGRNFMLEAQRRAAQSAARRASRVARDMELRGRAARTFNTPIGPVELDPSDPEKYAQQIQLLRGMEGLSREDQENLRRAGDLAGVAGGQAPPPGGTNVTDPALWASLSEDPAAVRDAINIASGAQDIVAALDEAIALRQESGAETFIGERARVARAAALQNRIFTAARQIQNTGTPQEFELEQLRELIPSATDIGGVRGGFEAAFRTVGGGTDSILERLVAARQNFANQAVVSLQTRGLSLDENSPGVVEAAQGFTAVQ